MGESVRRMQALALTTLLAIAATVGGLFVADRSATAWVRESRDVGRLNRDLLASLLKAEDAQQDLARSRHPDDLSRFLAASAAARSRLDSLRAATVSNADRQTESTPVFDLVERWLSRRVDPVASESAFAEVEARLDRVKNSEESRYRRRVANEQWWNEVGLLALIAELLAAVVLASMMRRLMLRQSEEIIEHRIRVGHQHEVLKQRATALEMVNAELSAAVKEAGEGARSLRLSEERYRALFAYSPLPMWVYDSESLAILDVNEAAIEAYGYSREEFLQLTLDALRPEEDVPGFRASLATLRPSQSMLAAAQWRHRRKNGSVFDVEIASHAIEIDGRKGRLVLAHDVSSRKRAEAELRRSNELLRAVIDESPLAIVVVDPDLRIRRWNGAAAKLLGGSIEDRVGTPYEALVPSGERAGDERLRGTAASGQPATNIDTLRLHRDGTPIEVSMSVAAIAVSPGVASGFVFILADARERHAIEARLRQTQKMEAVGQLAGGVAHDFNNILTVISSYAELVLHDLDAAAPARADLQQILLASDRAASLTRQLLAFSRKQMLRPGPVDLNGIVTNLQGMLLRLLPPDITIAADLDPHLGIVEADAASVEQVVVNLVVNARDAMSRGGTIRIETRNESRRDARPRGAEVDAVAGDRDFVRLTVRDSGAGMSPETQARIFEPFFTTKEAGKGTGLGLSTVYGIVKQSGGHVSVCSELGRGTEMTVHLPQTRRRVPEAPATPDLRIERGSGETILLADDDDALRTVVARALRQAGYRVVEARNGREAMAILQAPPAEIALVVADLVMPQMTGVELTEAMATRHGDVPMILMSGYAPESQGVRRIVDSGRTFLEKPFATVALVTLVAQVLAGSRGEVER